MSVVLIARHPLLLQLGNDAYLCVDVLKQVISSSEDPPADPASATPAEAQFPADSVSEDAESAGQEDNKKDLAAIKAASDGKLIKGTLVLSGESKCLSVFCSVF